MLEIEERVNKQIRADLEVSTFEEDLEKAKEMGAQALFGEKYDDRKHRQHNLRDIIVRFEWHEDGQTDEHVTQDSFQENSKGVSTDFLRGDDSEQMVTRHVTHTMSPDDEKR